MLPGGWVVTLVLTVSLGVRCADGVGWSSNKMLSSSSLSSSSRQLGGSHSLHDRIVSSTTSKSKTLEDEDDYFDEDYKDDEDLDDYLVHPRSSKKGGSERREWVSIDCPKELRGHCHCGHQRDPNDKLRVRPVVNCTHAGFTDTDFFKHVPVETEVLIVVGNELRELPTNLFGPNRDMLSLRELDLRQNGIELIRGKTFHHTPHLETLILNYNKIGGDVLIEHPRIFSSLTSLKYLHLTGAFHTDQWTLLNGLTEMFAESNLTHLLKLHLEQNHISRIPNPLQFCDLPSLLDLHLGQNELTDLVLDVEACLSSLRFVDLSYNKIREISATSGLFALLNHRNQMGVVVQLELYHNPFHCDCGLDHFLLWMRNMTLKDPDIFRHRTEMRCLTGYPTSNAKRMLQDVDHTECAPPPVTMTNTVINRLSWSVVSLIGLVVLISLSVAWVRLRGVPSCLRGSLISAGNNHPLLATTTSGVKYTSVDKEEAAEVAHV
ncbi:trophoblast glycoprotein-like [Folsomia candida]|uniref:trophoblast glycoprotein-like n=1 Tax=Folsomia candida TaxID=158441 RepID=UPI000B9030EF|nr:trophoblast glycoprotein-like [Folsomia candida]